MSIVVDSAEDLHHFLNEIVIGVGNDKGSCQFGNFVRAKHGFVGEGIEFLTHIVFETVVVVVVGESPEELTSAVFSVET